MRGLIGDSLILGGIGSGVAGVWVQYGMPWALMTLGAALVVTGISVVRKA